MTRGRHGEQWRKQERELETRSGLHRPPGSGAGVAKGDAHGEVFCVSAKATAARSFTITLDAWQKAAADARVEDRSPLMLVELGDGTRLAICLQADLEELAPGL